MNAVSSAIDGGRRHPLAQIFVPVAYDDPTRRTSGLRGADDEVVASVHSSHNQAEQLS
jgi:hypothetical protein